MEEANSDLKVIEDCIELGRLERIESADSDDEIPEDEFDTSYLSDCAEDEFFKTEFGKDCKDCMIICYSGLLTINLIVVIAVFVGYF